MQSQREDTMKKVLVISRAFPPFFPVGYSIRAAKFIKYLPALGWLPSVLTVAEDKEYETLRRVGSEALLSEIPEGVIIHRTYPGEPSVEYLEKERQFGKKNRLAGLLAKVVGSARRWMFRSLLPDRQLTWLPFAVRAGRRIIKREGIDIIFATCPPFSDALIGACLNLLTGKRLVLDFRDDWLETPWYYSKPFPIRAIESLMERWAVSLADKVILVTEWSRKAFVARYPSQPAEKFVFIPNGCDLKDFEAARAMEAPVNPKFRIVHAGSLNDSKLWARDPRGFFQGVRRIVEKQPRLADRISLEFAGDFTDKHRETARELGLAGMIREHGHLKHADVLRLMKSADLLMAMNYEGFATLIPGKIYEYWAVGNAPILLLSCKGAGQELLDAENLGVTVAPDDVDGIERAVQTMFDRYEQGNPVKVNPAGIEEYDRKALAEKLARVLSDLFSPK
ncbi:MAG: glycosyltransferase [Chloroflexi bacterium CFX1]|nr:glycosyltransferase [Chloroflexi bacterium CFX1]MCQ3952207.1 hypothetical protein [Chloroflexota bacterium]MDL1918492.1 glycosyltransferase family 4 protein [Chloroflexi bacterium CFX5]NUQ58476.1 glycosyltransferase [Anaerolineales bacterium]